MYVARTLKKRKTGYKGVKFPSRWRAMTLGEQRSWYLGVDMALAEVKRGAQTARKPEEALPVDDAGRASVDHVAKEANVLDLRR